MSDTSSVATALDVVARLQSDLRDLAARPLTSCADAELPQLWRELEVVRRLLAPVDHGLINEIEARHLPFAAGCKSTGQFARQVLRVSPSEAAARVKAARAMGTHHTATGVLVGPVFAQVAASQTAGEISDRHAAIIVAMIEKLPAEVRAEHDLVVEKALVDLARDHDPDRLGQLARDLAYRLDQDGQYKDAEYREKNRDAALRRRPDGSGTLTVEATTELAEYLATVMDALGAPKPAADGVKDPRTPGQRRHDALLQACRLLFQSGNLPTAGGCAVTILLVMTGDSYVTGTGTATTGHGYTVPADLAKKWAEGGHGAEARFMAVLMSKTKGIEAYSTIQRCHTEQQRLAMAARDKGCSFVGCDVPSSWTEAHHMTEFQETQRTSVDDGALLCGKDHDTFEAMGFEGVMINGSPHWKPPKHIDPNQVPRRNTMHDRLDEDP